MMSLLSVTVKKAHYVGSQAASQFNSYVTLKLQNVKSTTVTVKGATPCWEQDFLFETNDVNTGLLIEVWSKGMIWDRAMGYHWLPLQGVQYSNEEGSGQWLSLDAELVMRDGEVVGTKNPTGNSLLVDCRFELPFGRCDPPTGWRSILRGSTVCRTDDAKSCASIDPENIEASDLQRKLEMLNNIMDQEARAEQARRQMQYFGHSGYSEDSDYTSDLNYPVGQHANSSASQFRSAAHQLHTPQRSLETSRENSYERDDSIGHQHHLHTPATHQHHLSPGSHRSMHLTQRYSPNADDYGYGSPNVGQNTRQYQDNNVDSEPLFYNSRPRNKHEYTSQDWGSYNTYYNTQKNVDGVDMGYSDIIDQPSRKAKAIRRPSLERQTTLYDESTYYTDNNIYTNQDTQVSYSNSSSKAYNQKTEDFYNSSSYPFQEERYGQDEEDRQWDSGGLYNNKVTTGKKLPTIPLKRRSSVITQDDQISFLENSYSCAPTPISRRRQMPQIPAKRSASRQSSLNDESYDGYRTPEMSHRGASLPPTPTKTPKVLARLMAQNKPFNSLPPTPGRQLPKPNLNHRSAKARRNTLMKRTSSADYSDNVIDGYDYMRPGAVSASQMYNEDYNYAYQSIDNLPAEPEDRDLTPVVQSDNRTSVNVDTGSITSQAQTFHEQFNTNDYYYNAQYYQNEQSTYQQQQGENKKKDFFEVGKTMDYHTEQKNKQTDFYTEQKNKQMDFCDKQSEETKQTDFYNEQESKHTDFYTEQQSKLYNETSNYTEILNHQETNKNNQQSYFNGQSNESDYYGNQNDQKDYYNDEISEYQEEEIPAESDYYGNTTNNRRKMLGRSVNSPLLQQNTDSLESRDDELKDSFDTAVSSMNSSVNRGYSEYSTAGEPTSTIMTFQADTMPKTTTTTVQYHRDQTDSPKAIVTTNDITYSTPTSAVPTTAVTTRNNVFARGYLKQQDTIDTSYFQQVQQEEKIDYYNEQLDYEENIDYLDQNESIESYIEEETPVNEALADYNNKAINRESPASVIHVENYEDDQSLRRGSSQITVVDPFHPSLQRNAADPYASVVVPGSRRPSVDPYRASAVGDPYLNQIAPPDDPYITTPPRKPSVADSYQNGVAPPRRASARQSPDLERQDTADVGSMGEQEAEKKSVSFEEEEEAKPTRPQVTAQQRWHWAYNKIIMQLNVSGPFSPIFNPSRSTNRVSFMLSRHFSPDRHHFN